MAGKVTPFPEQPKAQPPMQVTSIDGASSWLFGRQERYNPDALAARKGGLGIYSRMLQDEQVKAVFKFKRDSIIGRGYEFAFDDTDLPDEEQKKRVKVMLQTTKQLHGSFIDGVVGVLKGMAFGYSITEYVTSNIKVDGQSYVGLAKLLPRDCATFSFETDDYGTLKRFFQKVHAREVDLDYSRFIHYVQNPDVDPYYGESELRAAYRPWFMKDLDLKLWAAYKERLAGGFVELNLGDSGIVPGSPDYQVLQSLLQNLRSAMGMILPRGVTANVHQPVSTDVYEKAIQFHELAIAKSLLIPNLLGLSHTGQTGAYAQSQTQLEAYFMTLATDTERLEQCLNDQLFRALALQNWDDGEYPRFRFKKATEEHVKWVVQSWKDLTSNSAVLTTEKDEAHLRALLNFPARSEQDVPLLKVKQDLVPPPVAVGPDGKPMPPVQPDETKKQEEPEGKRFTADEVKALIAEREGKIIEQVMAAVVEKFAAKPVAKTTFAEARASALLRVDFSVIASRSASIEQDTVEGLARLNARALRRLLTDEKLTELLDENVDDIGELKFDGTDIGKIKSATKDALARAWGMGLMQAMDETGKARKQAYSEDTRKLRFAALRDKAGEYFESQAFAVAGKLTDAMRAIVQQELLNAIKAGTRPEEVASIIYERLIRKGMTTLEAVQLEENRAAIVAAAERLLSDAIQVANVPAYLNTVARTSIFEAMNEARYAEFSDPELADFVQALQFSAILDDRTTEVCKHMDGHVHVADSPIWDRYRPPLHFNCRSVLFAVTSIDGWDGEESPLPTVEPQEGFG